MMKRLLLILLPLFFLHACVRNDIPFPYMELNIEGIEMEGQTEVWIDRDKKEVVIEFDELTDLSKVKVKSLKVSNDTIKGFESSVKEGMVLDMTRICTAVFSLYQDFEWHLKAVQHVDRYFKVDGQVGEGEIFPQAKKAIAYVAKGTNVSNINIRSLKLGLEGAVMVPDIAEIKDFSKGDHSNMIKVKRGDSEEIWTLYIRITNEVIRTEKVYPWVRIAWLYGSSVKEGEGSFEYCEDNGQDAWTQVDSNAIVRSGNAFHARLGGLQPMTKYKFRTVSGSDKGKELKFTTGEEVMLPNAGLDKWHKVGNVWNPWEEGGTSFWDTGNSGAATLGNSNSLPSVSEKYDKKSDGNGAKLLSQFVGIGTVGKFAAGNLYVGRFVRVDGTNGIIDMGREFSSFPVRLTGYYKFTGGPINYTSSEKKYMEGQPDTCSMYIALGDWDEPVEVRTKPSNRKLFDKNDPHVIAYAEFMTPASTVFYEKFSLDLEYRTMERTPKYLLIVFSASKYGDFFTGSTQSILWLDELQLEYE